LRQWAPQTLWWRCALPLLVVVLALLQLLQLLAVVLLLFCGLQLLRLLLWETAQRVLKQSLGLAMIALQFIDSRSDSH
jgi:hypothetical protein